MNCDVWATNKICNSDIEFLVKHATKTDSDFARKLTRRIVNRDEPLGGRISMVCDMGEIVGWCRTEQWVDVPNKVTMDTLEAFVREPWRRRGVCLFAAAGLMAASERHSQPFAIFSPAMIPACKRLGIKFIEYRMSRWERVTPAIDYPASVR